MTALDYTVKRRRPNQPTRRRTRAARTQILALLDWDALCEIAARLPGREDGTVGRPAHFPPAAVLLFGAAAWQLGGERAVEVAFEEDRALWQSVRRRLLFRYPGYPGLERNDFPMKRHHFRYYRDRYGIKEGVFEQLRADFRARSCELAKSFGLFDSTKGSWTHPAVENLGVGDGTTFKPRFKAVPGDLQLDRDTGELIQRRYDPDAHIITVTDRETGEPIQGPRGIAFGIVSASIPNTDNERVILATYAIRPGEGNDEAALGVKSIGELAPLLPGAQGFVWDKAMRGKHRDAIYKLGLLSIVKTAKAPGGGYKTALVEQMDLSSPDGTVTTVPVWAVNGALGMEVRSAARESSSRSNARNSSADPDAGTANTACQTSLPPP